MMMVVMMVLMLMLRSSSLAVEMGLLVLVEMMGVKYFVEGHSSEELPEYIHRIFEDEVEVSLA